MGGLIQCLLGEPGFEERETLANGLRTAALSGFTAIALEPETQPTIDSQSAVVQPKLSFRYNPQISILLLHLQRPSRELMTEL